MFLCSVTFLSTYITQLNFYEYLSLLWLLLLWLVQAGNNEPLRPICSRCCGEYRYFVSGDYHVKFFYKQQNYAVKFLWILKFIKFVWLLCIWGPGSPTDSVSFFISDRFMQLNLYEYLSLLYYFGLCKLATMSPLGWHPPCVVNNTDTLYLGDKHCQETVLVFFIGF